MPKLLRVVLADDERPARRFLGNLLKTFSDVEIVAEGSSGREAVKLIERHQPDLALLDLNMPEVDRLNVARLVKVHAIDYLLKPVERERLAATLDRARARTAATAAERTGGLKAASTTLDLITRRQHLERIPVRRRAQTVILPVRQIVSIIAEGELLHLTTLSGDRFTISYRLHALESRLDPRRFVRLSRGAVVAVDAIERFSPMPGGTYQVQLNNGQAVVASRIQSRILRETLLRI